LKVICCLADPFAVGQLHTLFATRAPCIRPSLRRVALGPEETDTFLSTQTVDDMLTNEGFLLGPVNCAFHVMWRTVVCIWDFLVHSNSTIAAFRQVMLARWR